MANIYNKFISFVIAISAYILIILAVMLYLKEPKIKKYNFKVKETIVQIDLVTNEKKPDKKLLTEKIIEKKIEKKLKEVKTKKSKSIDNKIKANLKSLFANVKTNAVKTVKDNITNEKVNKTKSRFKAKLKNTEKIKDIKISKLKKVTNISKKKNIEINKNDAIDDYYSEIKELILNRWYENPIFSTDAYIVKVYVTINTKGEFNYNIIKYSGNIQIDNILTKFLDEQISIVYPISKDNKEKTILINFMNDKEE